MTFTARYIPIRDNGVAMPYYRILHADSINEAIRLAKRYERKGYMYATIKQQLGKE